MNTKRVAFTFDGCRYAIEFTSHYSGVSHYMLTRLGSEHPMQPALRGIRDNPRPARGTIERAALVHYKRNERRRFKAWANDLGISFRDAIRLIGGAP